MKEVHKEETVGTLKFAERAKMIVCKAKSNVQRSAAELEKIIDQLKGEIASLKKKMVEGGQLVLGSEDGDEWKNKFLEIEAEYENYKDNAGMQIEQLRAQLESNQSIENSADYENLRIEQEFTKNQLEDLRVQTSENQTKFQEHLIEKDQKIAEIQAKCDEFEIQAKKLEADYQQLEKQKNANDENTIKLENDIFELKVKQEKHEKDLSVKDEQLAQAKETIQNLKDQMSQNRKNSSNAEEVQSSLKSFQNKIESLTEQLNKQKSTNNEQKTQVTVLEDQIQHLNQEKGQLSDELNEMSLSKNALNSKLADEVTKVETLSSQKQALEAKFNEVKEENAKMEHMLTGKLSSAEIQAGMEQMIEQRRQKSESLIESQNAEIEKLKGELNQLKIGEMINIKEQNEKLTQKVKQAQQQIDDSKALLQAKIKELELSSTKATDAEQALAENTKTLDEVNAELRQKILQNEDLKLQVVMNKDAQAEKEEVQKELKQKEEWHAQETLVYQSSQIKNNRKLVDLKGKVRSLTEEKERLEQDVENQVSLMKNALKQAENTAAGVNEKAYEVELKYAKLKDEHTKLQAKYQEVEQKMNMQARANLAQKVAGKRTFQGSVGQGGLRKSSMGMQLKASSSQVVEKEQEETKEEPEEAEQEAKGSSSSLDASDLSSSDEESGSSDEGK